jgi:ATP-dependent DNA helicase RecG
MTLETLLQELKKAVVHTDVIDNRDELLSVADAFIAAMKGYDALAERDRVSRLSNIIPLLARMKLLLAEKRSGDPSRGTSPEGPGKGDIPLSLTQSVQTLKGIGPKIAALLKQKEIATVEDLLLHLPYRYEDRRSITRVADAQNGRQQTVIGVIRMCVAGYFGRKRTWCAQIDDGTEILKVTWFAQGQHHFLGSLLKPGLSLILTGKISGSPFEKEMIHPEYEVIDNHDDQFINFKRIVPFYSVPRGLQQKTMRRILWKVVRDYAHLFPSPIPDAICQRRQLADVGEALRNLHFPAQDQMVEPYQEMRSQPHQRLIYHELFFSQLVLAFRKHRETGERGISFRINGILARRFHELLPFELTGAQKRAISEIERDMSAGHCMRRLLQGDVGSGKTVVALAALVTACENGYQAAVMAPTEILAEQHYRNLQGWCGDLGLKMALIKGRMLQDEKALLLDRMNQGAVDIVIGTHALLQPGVCFRSLGLVVIDEEHRFGVVQRSFFQKNCPKPDVLIMTATPIPRTLAMTVYGDLDCSVIDEQPQGRSAVVTRVYDETQRSQVYGLVRRELQKGNQIFIIYPLAEFSTSAELKDATRMAKHLQEDVFQGVQIGLVHGRMKSDARKRVMTGYYNREIQILVATTVVEVGIDVPDASLMIIEHAERFGLAQLHQLRGRVGRREKQGSCFLMTHEGAPQQAKERLRILEKTRDGFIVSEKDLALRGPGEFMGTRQSGLPRYRIADLRRDAQMLEEARKDAFELIDKDPDLKDPEHHELRAILRKTWGHHLEVMNRP